MKTYIALLRGNEPNPVQLARQIKQKLQDKYGFEVPSIILETNDLKQIIQNNPFARDPEIASDRLYVTFLFDTPRADLAMKLREQKKQNEQFIQYNKTIFLYYPDGYGRAVMNNNAFEKALKVEATTRNWKTINKLYEMTK
jgi:uncharacterized protein (DUF1697 family)